MQHNWSYCFKQNSRTQVKTRGQLQETEITGVNLRVGERGRKAGESHRRRGAVLTGLAVGLMVALLPLSGHAADARHGRDEWANLDKKFVGNALADLHKDALHGEGADRHKDAVGDASSEFKEADSTVGSGKSCEDTIKGILGMSVDGFYADGGHKILGPVDAHPRADGGARHDDGH